MKRIIKTFTKKLQQIREKRQNKDLRPLVTESSKETERDPMEITLSASTIVKILVIIGLFWAAIGLITVLNQILILAGICFFFALALTPICSQLEARKIPRPLSIILIYLIFFGFLSLIFVQAVPLIGKELSALTTDFSNYLKTDSSPLQSLQPWLDKINVDSAGFETFLADNMDTIASNLQSVAGSTWNVLTTIFKGVFNLIFSLVLIFFILMEREKIGAFFISLFPGHDRKYLEEKTSIIQYKVSDWIKAQGILMVSVGVLMFIGMKIFELTLGMKYAATIALIAGFLELFPYIGVTLTGLIILSIAINISWIAVIVGLAWIGVVQFIEGNVLVPLIMEKVVGLSSVATLLALAMGGILGNSIGGVPVAILFMILSIPIAACVSIFIHEYAERAVDK